MRITPVNNYQTQNYNYKKQNENFKGMIAPADVVKVFKEAGVDVVSAGRKEFKNLQLSRKEWATAQSYVDDFERLGYLRPLNEKAKILVSNDVNGKSPEQLNQLVKDLEYFPEK